MFSLTETENRRHSERSYLREAWKKFLRSGETAIVYLRTTCCIHNVNTRLVNVRLHGNRIIQQKRTVSGTHTCAMPCYYRHSVVTGEQQVRAYKWNRLILVVAANTHCSGLGLYAKRRRRSVAALRADWYPEYVPDHFQNSANSSVLHNIPVSEIHESCLQLFESFC